MKETEKPAIRFQGFSDAWEKRSMGELTTELQEYATLGSLYPLLTSSREGIMFQDEYRSNRTTENNKTPFSVVPYGKCTYRHMSDDDIFHFNINDIVEKGLVSKEYPVFDSTNNNDLRFIVALLNSSEQFRRFCRERKMGGTRTRLYYKHLRNFKPRCPIFTEQKRIADFLHNIKSILSHRQSELEKLQALKASMLEKMFPKDGADVPEVRFKGFTGAWERHKLDDLAVFNPKDELPEKFEYVDLESVVGTEMLSHRTEFKATAPSRAQRFAHTGDLFYQTVRPYQKNNYLFEKPDKYYVFSTGYAQMRPFVDGYFLLSLVQNDNFVKIVLDNCTGTSYPAINANDLAAIEVFAPVDKRECNQIGTFFRNLDNLITIHQRELNKLQTIKKALLEKMFV